MTTGDQFTIDTPEQTQLHFALAGIGSRFLALAVDTLVQFVAGMGLLVLGLLLLAGNLRFWPSGANWTMALLIFGWFLLNFGYFAIFESLWNGQTPGKRYTKIRVIKESGRPITAYEAITRNLVRIVDTLPGIYGFGLVTMILSPHNKRLGDYAAGTIVVRENALDDTPVSLAAQAAQPAPAVAATSESASQISPEELQLIEAFLDRRAGLAPEVRSKWAGEIAFRIANKLNLPPEQWRNAEQFLESLATERRRIAGYQ